METITKAQAAAILAGRYDVFTMTATRMINEAMWDLDLSEMSTEFTPAELIAIRDHADAAATAAGREIFDF
jgi:hypothetical protein